MSQDVRLRKRKAVAQRLVALGVGHFLEHV